MKPLEKQVTTSEQSKALKGAGIECESVFCSQGEMLLFGVPAFERIECPEKYIPRYTLSELLEMLPESVVKGQVCYHLDIGKMSKNTYSIRYTSLGLHGFKETLASYSYVDSGLIASAVALIERGLREGWLTAESINERCK